MKQNLLRQKKYSLIPIILVDVMTAHIDRERQKKAS